MGLQKAAREWSRLRKRGQTKPCLDSVCPAEEANYRCLDNKMPQIEGGYVSLESAGPAVQVTGGGAHSYRSAVYNATTEPHNGNNGMAGGQNNGTTAAKPASVMESVKRAIGQAIGGGIVGGATAPGLIGAGGGGGNNHCDTGSLLSNTDTGSR